MPQRPALLLQHSGPVHPNTGVMQTPQRPLRAVVSPMGLRGFVGLSNGVADFLQICDKLSGVIAGRISTRLLLGVASKRMTERYE